LSRPDGRLPITCRLQRTGVQARGLAGLQPLSRSKAIILGAIATFWGQKPAVENEKIIIFFYSLNEKMEFIQSNEMKRSKSGFFLPRIIGCGESIK